MNYIGTWTFHSVGAMRDNGEMVYLTAEEYLQEPMPYIDESDAEAVADEIKDRKSIIGMQVKVCDDGRLYMLMPIPEGTPQEELDQAIESGAFFLIDGMLADKAMTWEERDGELWYDTGIEGEIFGEAADSWVKALDDDGFFRFMTTRFSKTE